MEKQFEILKTTRKNIVAILEDMPIDSLFVTPSGFNNNVFWNAMHVIASQQLLVYGLSQNPFRIDKDLVFQFKSGTVPSGGVDRNMVQWAKENLFTTIDWMVKDYQADTFRVYRPITTSYGMKIQNVEDAIYFNNLHEAMHYGQIKMMRMVLENAKSLSKS